MQSFSVKESIAFGWNAFKSRPWIFVQAGVLLFLVNLAVNLGQTLLETGGGMAGEPVNTIVIIISAVIGMIASFLMSMGQTAFYLRGHENVTSIALKDLWHPQDFWKFLGASLLAGIAIIIGLIFLIIPGIILSLVLAFVGYLVIDEKRMPIDAIKESVRLTKGNLWKLFLLGLALFGINLLGFLLLLVGLLVTVPVSFLASVHAYRVLKGQGTAPVAAPEVVDTQAIPA